MTSSNSVEPFVPSIPIVILRILILDLAGLVLGACISLDSNVINVPSN